MTITLSIPAVWGLLIAAMVPYVYGMICAEEGSGINPLVSILLVTGVQVAMFLLVYGLMTLLGA